MGTAASGMKAMQTQIDTISNNLANVNTTGFKKSSMQFQDLLYETVVPGGQVRSDGLAAPTRVEVGHGVKMVSTNKNFSQGTVISTSNPLDLMIEGDGFFQLQMPDGDRSYTRDGSFRLDETGRLTTPGGLAVQGTGGPINAAGGKITVDTDGTITVGGANRGRLRVVTFDQPQNLEHRGDGLMRASESLTPKDIEPGETTVMQGYLEGSNVDPVRTLVDMIAAQRAFEVGSKVLQANDEMLGKSVNTLGRVT